MRVPFREAFDAAMAGDLSDVLTVAMLLAGNNVLPWIPVMFLLMILLAVFTTGVALALAAANVFYHDVNYLWSILVQILFYATPVIWNPAK